MPGGTRIDDDADVACACCGKTVKARESRECPMCKRRACFACLRPYGHHMQVCDECLVERW